MQALLRGEAVLSTFAAMTLEVLDLPRKQWGQALTEWRAYWKTDDRANTVKSQHRQAAFGWIPVMIASGAIGLGSTAAVEAIFGAAALNRYGDTGIPGTVIIAPMLLCAYHWIASFLSPDSHPGALGKWSISWVTDLSFVLIAYLIATS